MRNTVLFIFMLLVTAGTSFFATVYLMDFFGVNNQVYSTSWQSLDDRYGKSRYASRISPSHPLRKMSGAQTLAQGDELLLSSVFDAEKVSQRNYYGSVLFIVRNPDHILQTNDKAKIALEISNFLTDTSSGLKGQFLQMRFVQNDLKMSDWVSIPLKTGRHIYSIEYEPVQKDPDTRAKTAVFDGIWVRVITPNEQKNITIHELRTYGS